MIKKEENQLNDESRQNLTQNKVTETAGLSAGYNLAYNYDSTKKHQLKNIAEVEYRDKVTPKPATPSNKKKDNKYTYDANGNQIYVNTVQEKLDGSQDNKALEKTMLWDEENRLGAISINGYVSSYTYDASGERVSKLSGGGQGIFVNSAFSGGKTSTSDFTLYTSPYLVAQSGGRYTKHIYIGSQRIVSKLGDFDSYGADPRRIEKAGDSFNGVKVDYASKYKSALNVVKANYETLKVPYYGLDNDDYVNGLGFCCNPNPTTATTSPTGKSANNKNDNAELQQYYYHPDHLGSSSYISNLDGEVVQHVEYVPFGEVFLEEKNAVWNTPYLFNGKELDKETGMSYYGARYYDSKISVWVSVDPLVEKTMSSYGYCYNNPVNLVDLDGKEPDDWVEKKDGSIYWDDKATSQMTTKKGETYLGKNVVVATHNRDEDLNEPINSAKFDLYLESDKTGPSATIYGNTVPSDVSKSGTLAEGLYSAKFGHRNKKTYKNELALRIYNLDGTDGLPTVNGNPNPASNGKTLTGVLFHKGNNFKESLFDSRGNAYSHGCQTGGNYSGSVKNHNAFMDVAGKNFNGNYFLRSKSSDAKTIPTSLWPVMKNFSPFKF